MKERGLPQIPKIAQPNNEHLTSPDTQIKEPFKPEIINASGYVFYAQENIPYNKIPDAAFHYYEELGEKKSPLNVKIIEIGLDNPARKNEPIPLRIDHGCPCMELPLEGHDCAQQRELAFDAMKKIGRGMMIFVNSEASAGMGHGTLHAMGQQKAIQEALLAGEKPPSMVDYFHQLGIKEVDIRKHPAIAALIARRLDAVSYDEEQNPIIFLGSSPAKLDSLQNGHKIQIADTAHVIDADFEDHSKEELGYKTGAHITESGVYIEFTTPDGKDAVELLTNIFPSYKEHILAPRQQNQKEKIVYAAADKSAKSN